MTNDIYSVRAILSAVADTSGFQAFQQALDKSVRDVTARARQAEAQLTSGSFTRSPALSQYLAQVNELGAALDRLSRQRTILGPDLSVRNRELAQLLQKYDALARVQRVTGGGYGYSYQVGGQSGVVPRNQQALNTQVIQAIQRQLTQPFAQAITGLQRELANQRLQRYALPAGTGRIAASPAASPQDRLMARLDRIVTRAVNRGLFPDEATSAAYDAGRRPGSFRTIAYPSASGTPALAREGAAVARSFVAYEKEIGSEAYYRNSRSALGWRRDQVADGIIASSRTFQRDGFLPSGLEKLQNDIRNAGSSVSRALSDTIRTGILSPQILRGLDTESLMSLGIDRDLLFKRTSTGKRVRTNEYGGFDLGVGSLRDAIRKTPEYASMERAYLEASDYYQRGAIPLRPAGAPSYGQLAAYEQAYRGNLPAPRGYPFGQAGGAPGDPLYSPLSARAAFTTSPQASVRALIEEARRTGTAQAEGFLRTLRNLGPRELTAGVAGPGLALRGDGGFRYAYDSGYFGAAGNARYDALAQRFSGRGVPFTGLTETDRQRIARTVQQEPVTGYGFIPAAIRSAQQQGLTGQPLIEEAARMSQESLRKVAAVFEVMRQRATALEAELRAAYAAEERRLAALAAQASRVDPTRLAIALGAANVVPGSGVPIPLPGATYNGPPIPLPAAPSRELARYQQYSTALQRFQGSSGTLVPIVPNASGAYGIFSGGGRVGGGGFIGGGGGFGGGGGGRFFGGAAGASGGGFIDEFEQGFRGRRGLSYAEQFGQAAKFSVLYGTAYTALFQITQTLQASVTEAINFEKALIELNIATGETSEANRELAAQLGDVASGAGFAPSEGVAAGARAIGLYQLQGAPRAQQEAAALINAQVVTQASYVSGQQFQSIQKDIGAVAQAFDLGAESLTRIQDADAALTKRYGVVTGGSFESVAQVGSIARGAGFSLEETTALAAKLQSRTGQTPAAVAGLLSQFFGRSGDPALADKFQTLGIDTSQDYRSQILQLSQQDLSESERALIVNAFGRGRSGQAASIIVEDFQQILSDAATTRTSSAGAGREQFEERLRSVGGQLAEFGGSLKDFAKDLGEAGVLDALGALVVTADQVVDSANGLIEVFTLLPRPVRDAALAVAALGAASLASSRFLGTQGVSGAAGGFLSRAAGFGGYDPALGYPLAARGVGAQQAFSRYSTARGLGASIPSALGSVGARGIGSIGLAAIGGPVGAAVIGVGALAVAAGQAKQTLDQFSVVTSKATEARRGLSSAGTVDEYLGSANLLRGTASESFRSNDSPFSSLVLGSAPDRQGEALSALADYAESQAARLEAEEAQRAAELSTSVFGDDPATRGVDALVKGISLLDSQGASAAERFSVFSTALDEMAAASGRANDEVERSIKINREALAADAAEAILGLTPPEKSEGEKGIKGFLGSVVGGLFPSRVGGYTPTTGITEADRQTLDLRNAAIQEAIADSLPSGTSNGVLSDEAINAAAEAAVAALGVDQPQVLQDAVRQKVLAFFAERKKVAADAAGDGPISGKELGDIVEQVLLPGLEAELNQISPGAANNVRTDVLKKNLDLLKKNIDRAGGDVSGETIAQYNTLRAQYAESAIEDIEALRKARQSRGQINQTGLLRQAIGTAVRFGNAKSLATLIEQGGKAALNIARQAINEQIRIVQAAQRTLVLAAGLNASIARLSSVPFVLKPELRDQLLKGGFEDNSRKLAELESLTQAANSSLVGQENLYATGSDVTGSSEAKDTAAQIDAARRSAEATRTGSSTQAARAAIAAAAADMKAAKKNTVEYYNALAAWYSARDELSNAILDYKNTQNLLKIDLTDPVAEAGAALNDARRRLASSRARGKSPEVINAGVLDVRRAEIALESAKFNQWLSDLQTNEQLKRITHAQYIKSLEAEITRLKAIKKRTQQQQDQLNQAELALQAAKEQLQGQFNLGDIRIPSPYEARRLAAAQAGGQNYQSTSTNTTIYIDGTDTGLVEQVIVRTLGPASSGRSTTTIRRT